MRYLVLFAALVGVCSAGGCKAFADPAELHVLPLTYKSHTNYVLFGKLTACPRAGEVLSHDLRFIVMPKDDVNIVLLNDRYGDFMFTPEIDFEGIVTFWYQVRDGRGTSELGTVTISIKLKAAPPPLNVTQHIVGLEDSDVELDMVVESVTDHPDFHDMSLAICNCAHDVTCNQEAEDCHCHLSLPDGWEILSGDRRLSLSDLASLDRATASNLVLRAAPSSSAEHCLVVRVLNPDHRDDPSVIGKDITIHIHPIHSTVVLNQPHPLPQMAVPHPGVNTTQGTPYRFSDLQLLDLNGDRGTYMVTIRLDHGGLLWVKQDQQGVVFLPRTEEIYPEQIKVEEVYELLDRFGTFKARSQPFSLEENNNGVKMLRIIGSLEGLNEVLKTLTFIPWCDDWPTPPSWPVPEDSWMENPSSDPTPDPHHPNIWPQWYPRFWYPFYTHPWSWWPRVLAPWWMTTACSDWTSNVQMSVWKVPSRSCSADPSSEHTLWSAKITVTTSGDNPKSLITSNHFSYFKPDARSAQIDSVYMRSLDYDLGDDVTLKLTVLESNQATAEFSSTGQSDVTCGTVEDCNNYLKNIIVAFKQGTENVCNVTIQINLLKHNPSRLGDRLVVWMLNTTRECLDVTATHPDFELIARDPVIMMRQGSYDNPLHLMPNISTNTAIQKGILHVKVFAKHGLVTMKVPDGLRIYSDHMGQHKGIPTYLCIAGPVAMVMNALATARLTPFKHLRGETRVTVDYRMPSTASRLLYGEVRPFRRLQVTIQMTGVVPSLPVVIRPPEICVTESAPLAINMIHVLRKFKNDEPVTFDIVRPQRGALFVNTSDKGLYECPAISPDLYGMCAELCGGHLDCPDTNLCCSNGCGYSCVAGEPRAGIHVSQSGQVIMHGYTHDINQNLLRNVIQYTPAPCGERETAYTDTITIRIIPTRTPVHDSVREVVPIRVTCAGGPQPVAMTTRTPSQGCEWSAWSSCLMGGATCGLGNQQRRKTCSSRDVVENRPCISCTCSPVNTTLVDPQPSMVGCSSTAPVLQCPPGCSVESYHPQTVAFECPALPSTVNIRPMDVDVHDTCTCDACTSGRRHG